ncbi:hypothetical protein H074_16938 [Amycolatopsis decaplanina DSM 44594]|uniref:Uncharacterized protein n=1 Tax=Amycolatopsis decaplanina DSM 44594 TaxID=1284240 RepID=M2ZDZ0_9PSEU|nr:hypothetical protein H074_16938 [Amycolatopsis decaplanina DSM 44594]
MIDQLWNFYVAADGPPIRRIAEAIEELDDEQRKGSANHETVRRTLSALALPQWQTVEVLFLALCRIANVDPDDEAESYGYEDPGTHRQELRDAYRLARFGHRHGLPRTRTEKAQQEHEANARRQGTPADDPWTSAPPRGGGFADEPPF